MAEKVAVVASRDGADLGAMSEFLVELRAKHPETVLVSGGARGGDKHAETTWISLGGVVISLRPKQTGPEEFVIERWELGGPQPRIFTLEWTRGLAGNYASACILRDMLIADEVDRLAAFMRRGGSRGAGLTAELAEGQEKPVYRFEAE